MRIRNVRRAAAITVGSAALLAGAGVAQAGEGANYQGSVKGEESYLTFDVEKGQRGKRIVTDLSFGGPTTCRPDGAGPPYSFGEARGSFVLKRNAFEGERKFSDELGGDGTISIDGTMAKKGVFRGTLQIKQVYDDVEGGEIRCNTGKLDYKAEKGATTTP